MAYEATMCQNSSTSYLDGAPPRVGDEVHRTGDIWGHREPQQEVQFSWVDLFLHEEDLESVHSIICQVW